MLSVRKTATSPARLRQAGLRPTRQRVELASLLFEGERPACDGGKPA